MLTFPVLTDDVVPVRGPRQGEWTQADWETLPHDDGNRYEIIEGVLYVSKSPSSFHQWVIVALVEHLGIPAKHAGLAYTFVAPIGVFMPGSDPVQPDFVVVRSERQSIIRDRRIFGVPDLIVEVLSPGNADYDEDVKLTAYATAGVEEYALVDLAARVLRVYRLREPGSYDPLHTYGAEESVSFACLPSISFRLGDLFDGAPDTTL
ncbi:MAG: Uma2 family endonuclease [Anaerolineae bacterium]|nr:Uma2 family endonuclease [Anaerolineae bacterium]